MKITIRESRSALDFGTKGGGSWKVWDRFISIGGREAYHIGNICGTCAFFFQRLDGANQSLDPRDFQDQLAAGLSELTAEHVAVLSELLPDGDYDVSLLCRVPRLISPGSSDDYFSREQLSLWGIEESGGLPHDPRTKYYRGEDRSLGGGAVLYEFLVPMFPETCLDPAKVSEFEAAMQDGLRPTALAVSVLDIKQPAIWEGNPQITAHWCLAHYIIDGHHKMFAASRARKPIGLVSALALGRGISSPDDCKRVVAGEGVD